MSVDKLDLYSALRSESGFNTLFNLDVGGDTVLVVAREVQRHPVRNEITHLDFIKVSLDIEIEAEVNLEFVGLPLAVSQDGAVLDTIETRSTCWRSPPPSRRRSSSTYRSSSWGRRSTCPTSP